MLYALQVVACKYYALCRDAAWAIELVQVTWFLKRYGSNRTYLFKVNDVLFIVT